VDAIDMMNTVPGEYTNGARALSPLRARKDDAELDLMRYASEIADAVMDDLSRFIKKGMTEAEIKEYMLVQFTKRGGEGPSFSPIAASGPGGAMPHYGRSDRVLRDGDFVIIDMGCRYRGYCSDMTRTFCIGEPTGEQRGIYETVLRAQKAGEAAVQPGVTGQDVDRAARKVIADAGYGANFINRLGHGIGIAVHEDPYIIEGNDVPLRPGNVFSIEPGIYLPGRFGVRIENLVAVRPDGTGEALNKFTRDLIVIE
jgi:Xaa-Pro aminopeptidase